ncbi:hypothetical protein D3C80_1972870 [compost metagenome]
MGGPNEFSVTKAQRLLGYRPPVSFEAAMVELAEHFSGQRQGERAPASQPSQARSQA